MTLLDRIWFSARIFFAGTWNRFEIEERVSPFRTTYVVEDNAGRGAVKRSMAAARMTRRQIAIVSDNITGKQEINPQK
jgi:hypothetical protein